MFEHLPSDKSDNGLSGYSSSFSYRNAVERKFIIQVQRQVCDRVSEYTKKKGEHNLNSLGLKRF